ncbi:DNRLRE domain-containing protein [bacterium]|nr:DNRLRE domain-containing protein [bacterium]
MEVTLKGEHFSGATTVSFGGVSAEDFSAESETVIHATVPANAKTGKIGITTDFGSGKSEATFTVKEPVVLQEAKLRLWVIDASSGGGGIYSVSDDWEESSLVWSNAPEINGKALSSVGSVNPGEIVEFDVTAAISGDGTYSFGMRNNSPDAVKYSSKEGSFVPELLIVTGDHLAKNAGTANFSGEESALTKPDLIPDRLQLSQNYPNPFNLETKIEYGLPEASHVSLRIFNLRGQVVRTLVDHFQSPGLKSVRWNGRDNHGREIASGAYIVLLQANEQTTARKLILQK